MSPNIHIAPHSTIAEPAGISCAQVLRPVQALLFWPAHVNRRAVAWTIIVAVAMFATYPGRAQTLRLAVSDLLGFECRIVRDAECACSPSRGQPTMPFTELTGIIASQPAQSANVRDALLQQSIWRRQCGLLTEADTAP